MAKPTGIKSLSVILTAGCNLRCGYCYQNTKNARRMEWETLRASADLVLASRQRDVRLLFIGGEPLLEFPMIRRAVAYVEERRPPTLRVHYNMITNGILLGEEQAAFLAEHDFEVQLSFDGVPAAQDLRGKGTFAVLDRLLDRLRVDHPRFFSRNLTVGMTLTAATVPSLAESVQYFLEKGVPQIALSPSVTHQPDWRTESMAQLDREYARIFDASVAHFERTGEVPFLLFRSTREPSVHEPAGLGMCGVGQGETPAVDVDGEVHGCVMFAESYQVFPTRMLKTRLEAMKMGNLRGPDLAAGFKAYPRAARAARIFDDKQDKYSSYGRCGECRFLSSCAVCPVSIGHQPGNEDPRRVPDFLCAYNLVSLEYRDRFPRPPDATDILMGRASLPTLTAELGRIVGIDRSPVKRGSHADK
jgi:sulfatase maturation enzyme AslB (radical SAM superfamily)